MKLLLVTIMTMLCFTIFGIGKYAILICGTDPDANPNETIILNEQDRLVQEVYRNDTAMMWKLLVSKGFNPADICRFCRS